MNSFINRYILITVLLLILFFCIMSASAFIVAFTTGKLAFLIPAFIMLLIAAGGIYMLVYKV